MTVSELKKALQDVPDDFPVTLFLMDQGKGFCGRDIAYADTLRDDTGEDWGIFALIPTHEGLCVRSGYLAIDDPGDSRPPQLKARGQGQVLPAVRGGRAPETDLGEKQNEL